MIGKQTLEAAGIDPTPEQCDAAEKVILQFAVKDIPALRDRMTHLLGLRLLDAIADPNTTASHLNAAMKWLEQTDPKQNQPEDNPMLAAIQNARQAMQEGGKLPEIDEYAEDAT